MPFEFSEIQAELAIQANLPNVHNFPAKLGKFAIYLYCEHFELSLKYFV